MQFESSVISYGSKTNDIIKRFNNEFESSVISYGSKTNIVAETLIVGFESSVISYGSKTKKDISERVELFESSVISYGSKHLPHLPAPQAASKDIETCFLPCVSTQYIGNFFFDAVVGCVIGVKSPAVKIKSATIPSVTTGTFLLFSNFFTTFFNFCNIKNHPETILFGVIFLMPFIQKLSGKNLLNLIYHWYLYKYPTVFLRRTDYRQQLQHAL